MWKSATDHKGKQRIKLLKRHMNKTWGRYNAGNDQCQADKI